MISPNDWKQQAQAQTGQETSLHWLLQPALAQAAFRAAELPTRKTERWKYTPVTALLQQDFLQPAAADSVDEGRARDCFADLSNASRVVLVNGQLNCALSDFSALENQGVLTLFSSASPEQRELINMHLGSALNPDRHLFAALNYSHLPDGLLLHAPALQKLAQPVYVVYLGSAQDPPAWAQTRVLVVAEPGAELQLIEQFDSIGEQNNLFHNHVTEIVLQPNARLQHTRLQVEQEALSHVNGLHVKLAGENAACALNGVFLSKHRQHIDNHLNLEHATPLCTSNTAFKGFVTDESRAIFNGRIHIHPQAQKTEAHLNNRNLLLSKKAELDTKPELEIYADDVKCSHGASIGQLDEKSLFYFQSRGIDKASAEAMLCLGFVNEKVEQIPSAPMQALAQHKLGQFFNDVEKLKTLWSL